MVRRYHSPVPPVDCAWGKACRDSASPIRTFAACDAGRHRDGFEPSPRLVAQAILDLLRDLQERLEVGYLFISHDISTVARVADTIAVMQNSEVVEHGSTEDVLAPPHHPYTALLLKSVPDMKTDWLDTLVLPGPLERGGARAMAARTGA